MADPSAVIMEEQTIDGEQFVRVAIADPMQAEACVSCHNTHPDTPKNDWKLGDTRGVLEVKQSITAAVEGGSELSKKLMLGWLILLTVIMALLYSTLHPVSTSLNQIIALIAGIAKGDYKSDTRLAESSTETGRLSAAYNQLADGLNALSERAKAIASGDLTDHTTTDINLSTQGTLADSFDSMQSALQSLINQMQDNSEALNGTASRLLSTAHEQQAGTAEQAAAVEETQQTLESLLQSARAVAENSQLVFDNADLTQKNAEMISDQISELSSQTKRITEILELIRGIAQKSDLLALNAALEGTKAGEAGRGFSLVATQMQRLAEQVMGSVQNIESLTNDIGAATGKSVLATEEATKLAEQTTRSAREITMTVKDQETGTQQASIAMAQITEVTRMAATSATELVTTVDELNELSEALQESISGFKVD